MPLGFDLQLKHSNTLREGQPHPKGRDTPTFPVGKYLTEAYREETCFYGVRHASNPLGAGPIISLLRTVLTSVQFDLVAKLAMLTYGA